MKKIILFINLSIILISAQAQVNEVLVFDTKEKPKNKTGQGHYQDQIFKNKYYYITQTGTYGDAYLYALDGINPPEKIALVNSKTKITGGTNSAAASMEFKSNESYLYFVTVSLITTNSIEYELWRTDGTSDGTILLLSYIGNGYAFPPKISNKEENSNNKIENSLNGSILFIASNPSTSRSLWITDGTVAGTKMIKEFDTGNYDQPNIILEKIGSTFLFLRYSTKELWKTDGTTAGTSQILDSDGLPQKVYLPMGTMNGRFYFSNFNKIFSTDGITISLELTTPTNSSIENHSYIYNNTDLYYLVEDMNEPKKWSVNYVHDNISTNTKLTEFDGEIYRLEILSGTDKGVLLNKYSASGTLQTQVFINKNTKEITTFPNGINYKYTNNENNSIVFNDDIYFGAPLINDANDIGAELYKINSNSSFLVKDIYPGTTNFNGYKIIFSSGLYSFFVLNDKLYFVGTVGADTKLFTLGSSTQPLDAITSSTNATDIIVYPNPSTGEYTLHINEDLIGSTVHIYSVLGEYITTYNAVEEDTKHNLSTGMYFIQIENQNKSYTQKIIIK